MRSFPLIALAGLLTIAAFTVAPAPAHAQATPKRIRQAKGQACQWCGEKIDPETYVTPPGAPYQMYCNENCINEMRADRDKSESSYLTPIFGGVLTVFLVGAGALYLRGKAGGEAGPQASELMRQRAAAGRAPNVASLGTAHFRCTSCGRNLPSASNCTYCGGEVEPIE